MCVNCTVFYVYKVKYPCLAKHPAMKAYGGMALCILNLGTVSWLCFSCIGCFVSRTSTFGTDCICGV